MGKEFKTYTCKYKADWPVDEYGRLGGMYSLADLPVQGYVELERKGTLVSQDSKRKMYEVQDNEKVFVKRVVPFDKVSNIEEVDE
tara:strand:+ start:3162 stop:3416 length:255 start_codon:yes stop_codon:yes gene_type:complete